MKRTLAFLSLLLLITNVKELYSQPISAFTDIQRNFQIFDQGSKKKIESLLPLDYKIGRIAIPYIDNSKNFKIYSNRHSVKINDGFTNRFEATDNLIAYYNARALWVWENGETYLLTGIAEQSYVSDSLVLYFDGVQKEFKAYYQGEIYPIEDYLGSSNRLSFDGNVTEGMSIASGQLPSAKVGPNIAAYVDYSEQFKYFKQGEIHTLESYLIQSFDVGRNIIAYVDGDGYFKILYNDEVQELESFAPQSYAAGNEMVAYIDEAGYFKIFYKNELIEVGYFDAQFQVKDNVIAFSNSSKQFLGFYEGQFYTLENFTPSEIKMSYNSIAFVGSGKALKLFTKGEIHEVTRADIQSWDLNYDVLKYQFGRSMIKVFYEGETY